MKEPYSTSDHVKKVLEEIKVGFQEYKVNTIYSIRNNRLLENYLQHVCFGTKIPESLVEKYYNKDLGFHQIKQSSDLLII